MNGSDLKHEINYSKENKIIFFGNSITQSWSDYTNFFVNNGYLNKGISRQTTDQMLLRFKKDVVDEKAYCVVILAGINDNLALKIYNEAIINNMSVIVEVHNKEEALRSKNFKEAMIGINNRNLKTLETNINTTYDLFHILADHTEPLISESGIKNDKDIMNIKNKTNIKTFLIGESLLKSIESNPIFDCFA